MEEMLGVDALEAVKMNFDSDDFDEYDEVVVEVDRFEFISIQDDRN